MALITPPLAFAYCTDNLTGTPAAATPGTAVTAGGSANTDGTAVTLLSALGHDAHFICITLNGGAGSSTATDALLDILVDPAGGTSFSELISDLACGYTASSVAGTGAPMARWFFPLWIAAGTTIGAQVRSAAAGITKRVICTVYGEPSRPDMWWCGQGVETLGANPATSKGTTITPGSSGAAGTYTNVGGPTTYRYGAVQLSLQGPDATATARGGYWNIGADSARLPGSPTLYTSMNTSEQLAFANGMPIWCDIPAGKQLQVAGTLSGTTENYNACLHGVY